MEQQGWVAIHRKIVDWQWYKDIPCRIVFEHLLFTANHKPAKWQTHSINRGQTISSLENLAFETGLSVPQVRYAIKKLKSTGELASKSTNKFTLFTVTNYDFYQEISKPNSKPLANECQTNSKPLATNNNKNNENKDNNLEPKYFFDANVYRQLKQKSIENSFLMTLEEKIFLQKYEENQIKQMRKK